MNSKRIGFRTQRVLALLGSLVVFGAIFGFAQGEHDLTRRPSQDDEIRYQYDVTVFEEEAQTRLQAVQIERVTAVDDDGGFAKTVRLEDAQVTFNDQTVPMPNQPTVLQSYDSRGVIQNIVGENTSPDVYRLEVLNTFVGMAGGHDVGDAWVLELPANGQKGWVATRGEYEFVAIEEINDEPAAKLRFDVTEKEGSLPASNTGTVWLRLSDGEILKLESSLENAPLLGKQVRAEVSMEAIPAE
jgi:hypothetical protein